MIIDHISRATKYYQLNQRFSKAFTFLEGAGEKSEPGRLELDNENLIAIIQEYNTKPLSEGFWEAHRKYIDIQFLIFGTELIGYSPIELMQPEPYDSLKDLTKCKGSGSFLSLNSGFFMILFPEDAHMPGIAVNSQFGKVRKVVLKVALEKP
ncbi:MAG: YhcH/YjgK/YiaL family protein [Candidatus Riflebacteria bacterium]|nr:YhcH/YjgK/YiaL family protein [Candidatus Riflebacteria bacterium]